MTGAQLTSFKGVRRQDILDAWEKFSIDHPEFEDADSELALLSESRSPKPDYGNKMTVGATWFGDDKQRTRRNRTPRPVDWRPTAPTPRYRKVSGHS